jgi:hypothetical protein
MKLVIILMLVCSVSVYAEEPDGMVPVLPALQVSQARAEADALKLKKDKAISECVDEYVKKQSKSYSKIAQSNLYNLIHNFDKIASQIYGKKGLPDDVSYDEKIEALGYAQCEAYYKIGILK